MKVVVSYACDLEDIPQNAGELLNNLMEQFYVAEQSLEVAIEQSRGNAVSDAMETIDDLRQTLAKVDLRLMDCTSILAGYSKTNADIRLGHDPSQVMQGTQEVVPQDILSAVGDTHVNSEKSQND